MSQNECLSCNEGMDEQECPDSKKECGHHCNHIWTHDKCCWCGYECLADVDPDDNQSKEKNTEPCGTDEC